MAMQSHKSHIEALSTPNSGDQQEIQRALDEALSGLSIDELLTQSLAKPAAATGGADRPARGGRPVSQPEGQRPGSARRGVIAAIRDGNVFVDLGGKSQGIAPLEQFDAPPADGSERVALAVGQEFEFVYTGYDRREGLVLLSRKGAVSHSGLAALHEGDTVEGVVTAVNKGGLELKINNAHAFMPAGQADIKFNSDLQSLVGQKVKCRVTQVSVEDRRLIVSRRAILEQERAVAGEKLWRELATGQIREGVVSSVQAYGAFVDLGGVDGLLHVSAMSHTRVSDPNKIVKPGDRIQVMIIALDAEKQRVSLGLKQLVKDPWDEAAEKYPPGSVVAGTVKTLMDFGAFVEIAPGVEGLVHISELSNKRVNRVSEAVQVGQSVQAKVLAVDTAKKRISLSLAALLREAASAQATAQAADADTPVAGTPQQAGAQAATAVAATPGKPKPTKSLPLKGGL